MKSTTLANNRPGSSACYNWLSLAIMLALTVSTAQAQNNAQRGRGGPEHPHSVQTIDTLEEQALDEIGTGYVVNVRDYGAVGNGSTNDLPAFNAALDAIRSLDSPSGSKGTTLLVPYGTYRLSGTLHLDRGIILRGVSGSGWYGGSVLQFDSGVPGIVIHRAATSADGGRGDWSVIRDLVIQASGKSGTAHGVQLNARASIENCLIRNFSGNGIHINASGNHNPPTNANNWNIYYTRVQNNNGHGLYVNGGDANAGLALGLDSSSNGGWGVYDSSFLGNTYVATHTAANAAGAYKTDGLVARSVFIGCYSEQNQTLSEIVGPSIFLGGSLHGFNEASTGTIIGSDATGAIVRHGSIRSENRQGPVTVMAYLGVPNHAMVPFQLNADNSRPLTFRYRQSGNFWNVWEIASDSRAALGFGTTGSSHWPRGTVFVYNGLHLTNGSNQRMLLHTAQAQPTSGTWERGDIVWNNNPTAGRSHGWVCVSGGTPGTWVELPATPLKATLSWNPSSMPHATAATTTVNVPGASVGDLVTVSFSSIGSNLVSASGSVQSSNTVRVMLMNMSGSSINLPTGTLHVQVTKP